MRRYKINLKAAFILLIAAIFLPLHAKAGQKQSEFSKLDCEHVAKIVGFVKVYEYKHDEIQSLMFEAGMKTPLVSMDEADALALFNRFDQCRSAGKSGGVFVAAKLEVTKPFATAIEKAKHQALVDAAAAEVRAAILQFEKEILASDQDYSSAEVKIKEMLKELDGAQHLFSHNEYSELNYKLRKLALKMEAAETNVMATQITNYLNNKISELTNSASVSELSDLKNFISELNEFIDKIRKHSNRPTFGLINAERNATIEKLIKNMNAVQREAKGAVQQICLNESMRLCSSMVRDFPLELKNDYVVYSSNGNITLFELACAAKNNGMYKKINNGGLFSSEVELHLESGVIYFDRKRIDLRTLQEVSSSFKGDNVINMLVATKFSPTRGKTVEIARPQDEIVMLRMQLGALPKAPECGK